MKKIIINSEEMQTRVAVVHDGVLHDFFMDRNERSDRLVGSIENGKLADFVICDADLNRLAVCIGGKKIL